MTYTLVRRGIAILALVCAVADLAIPGPLLILAVILLCVAALL